MLQPVTRSGRNKLIRLALIVVCMLIALAYSQLKQSKPNNYVTDTVDNTYYVTEVFDGDTIQVNMNGKQEKIRLIGVDTPETHDPRKPVQCFGKAASEFTSQKLLNQRVRLESDPQSTNRDRYDRLLRYVYDSNGTLINQQLIADGYGFAYTGFPFSKSNDFTKAQETARSQNKGLWAGCQPSINQSGGYTSNAQP